MVKWSFHVIVYFTTINNNKNRETMQKLATRE